MTLKTSVSIQVKRILDFYVESPRCDFCGEEKQLYKEIIDITDKDNERNSRYNIQIFSCKDCFDILYEMIDEPKEKMVMTVELPILARLVLDNKDPLVLTKLLVLEKRNLKK